MDLDDAVRRLVRHISAWAWPVVWDAGEVHELHYRHKTRTYGGDVERTDCMSRWTTRAEAEKAERDAWLVHGWKKDRTVTWIEMRPVYSTNQAQRRQPTAPPRVLDEELVALRQRVAELERGEYICRKCGLRKDADKAEDVQESS